MPMGIKPASHQFQRTMDKTFEDLSDCILPPFFDDIIIKGTDFQNALSNVDRVLSRVAQCNFTLNTHKCAFFQQQINYLGCIVSNGTVRVDPDRISTIVSFPTPQSVKSLRRFLGMAQFCNRFIKNLNTVAGPLYDLLKPSVKFNRDERCQTAFDHIKQLLSTAPVLRSPTVDDYFILETDASDIGVGSCLKVKTKTNEEHIVWYDSSKFNPSESNWNVIEKEAYAELKSQAYM